MSKIGVSLKINVSQIDKMRLFSGQKGKYLDATVFIDINDLDQYGNSGMITQDVSKDEKAQGVKGNILGNCKVFWNDAGQSQQQQAPQYQQQAPQQQGGYQQQAPQQAPQTARQATNQAVNNNIQQGGFQQAPSISPQEPVINYDDDIPF